MQENNSSRSLLFKDVSFDMIIFHGEIRNDVIYVQVFENFCFTHSIRFNFFNIHIDCII